MDVRRAPPAVGVGHRIGGRLDGAQPDAAVLVGREARRAVEVRIRRRIVAVVGMYVLAGRVAVPDLHQRAGHRDAALVHDAYAHVDQLADGAPRALAGEIAAGGL